MELIDVVFVILLGVAMVFGYWRGLASGYNMKVADANMSKLVNIQVEKVGDSYHFREYESNAFITQNKSINDGLDYVRTQFGQDKIILLAVAEIENEPV